MKIPGITWVGGKVDDEEMLGQLPHSLVNILNDTNGFILYDGALHVRGSSFTPEWHSIRVALRGNAAFHKLYESVLTTDVPFAQDQVGDQFILRDGRVLRLSGETGETEPLSESIDEFFRCVGEDIKGFLNVCLGHTMQPGQLLLAYPPFVFQESGEGPALKAVPAEELIKFHADLARKIQDVPEGGRVEFKL